MKLSKHMKHPGGTICLAAIVAAVIAVTVGAAQAAEKVRIATLGTVGDLSMYLGIQEGFYKEAGIDLEIIPFKSGAQMVAPLGTGQVDIAAGVVAAGLYNLSGRGVPFKIVADRGSLRKGFGYMRLVVRKDLMDSGKFKTLGDLKGLRLGTQSKGGAAESTLNQALLKGKLTYDDVQISYLGHSDLVAGLENGAIDGGFLTEPNATLALRGGKVTEVTTGDVIDEGGVLGVLIYGADFIASRPKVGDAFMQAFLKGCRMVNDAYKDGALVDGPLGAKVVSAYKSYIPLKDESVIRTMRPSGCDPSGHVNMAKLQESYDFFKERGNLQPGSVGINEMVDLSFVDRASQALGAYAAKQN